VSSSIFTSSNLDGLRGLENSGFSEFVSVRMVCSDEHLESLDERVLMLNVPDTRRDVDEDMRVVAEESCSGAGGNKCKDLTK